RGEPNPPRPSPSRTTAPDARVVTASSGWPSPLKSATATSTAAEAPVAYGAPGASPKARPVAALAPAGNASATAASGPTSAQASGGRRGLMATQQVASQAFLRVILTSRNGPHPGPTLSDS